MAESDDSASDSVITATGDPEGRLGWLTGVNTDDCEENKFNCEGWLSISKHPLQKGPGVAGHVAAANDDQPDRDLCIVITINH